MQQFGTLTLLAVDIGGTNMRAGVVQLNAHKATDLSAAGIWGSEIWRHCEEKPKREEAVERLGTMLKELLHRAEKEGLNVAPFLGVLSQVGVILYMFLVGVELDPTLLRKRTWTVVARAWRMALVSAS